MTLTPTLDVFPEARRALWPALGGDAGRAAVVSSA